MKFSLKYNIREAWKLKIWWTLFLNDEDDTFRFEDDLSMNDAQPSQPVNHFHWLKTHYTNKSSENLWKGKKKTSSEANDPKMKLNIYGACQLSFMSTWIHDDYAQFLRIDWLRIKIRKKNENFISGNKSMSSFERVP